jgi:signal transduction histidine kinase
MTQALAALVRNELECQQPGGTLNITVAKQDTTVSITIAREPTTPNGQAGHAALELPFRAPKRGLNEIRTAYTLSAVSKIVEAHRGRIHTEERPEGGPAFVITLPLGARRVSPQKSSPRKAVRSQLK